MFVWRSGETVHLETVAEVRERCQVRTATSDGVALDLANQVGFPDGMRGCGDGTAIIAIYNPELAEAGRAVRFNLATSEAVQEWTPGSPRCHCGSSPTPP